VTDGPTDGQSDSYVKPLLAKGDIKSVIIIICNLGIETTQICVAVFCTVRSLLCTHIREGVLHFIPIVLVFQVPLGHAECLTFAPALLCSNYIAFESASKC